MTEKTDIAALREECAQWVKDTFRDLINTRTAENGDGYDYMAWDMEVIWRAWRHLSGKLEAERQQREAAEAAALAMRDDMRVAREELAALRGEQEPVAWIKCGEVTTEPTTADVWIREMNEGYGYDVEVLCKRQPKPVVVLPAKSSLSLAASSNHRSYGDGFNKALEKVRPILEAAGIFVKDDE